MQRLVQNALTIHHFVRTQLVVFLLLLLILRSIPTAAQHPASPQTATTQASATPLRLTLSDALALAHKNSVVYQAALSDALVAREDRTQARDALLPQTNYNNEYLYTQSNSAGGVRFIANNAVHEFTSQGDVHEVFDAAGIANYRKASAAAAVGRARAEIASRGLVVAVTQNYFAVLAAHNKLETAQRAAEEGDRFLKLTQSLERGGEVAHADVIKADLQAEERRRQLQE